mgnify:CR=1 FL=1
MAAIKTLSCDLETYSSIDIGKCGVYRYAESNDFEILLFAYSCDYGPVQLVDLAQGEVIPDEVVSWIFDPAVEKTAFNANFERTCLTQYFSRDPGYRMILSDTYCKPEQWSCTMILAASCGLPMSLAGVGAALQLPEDKAKMKEGKDLIRYFCQPCKPTKTNGQRTRNLPEHAPDKWKVFRDYNIRDVETENTIRQMLIKWRPDYSEQQLWCLDQRMNDAGVRIEPRLAENAIKIGDKYREELIARCKQLTGLDNPNSTAQIKTWLEEQEGVEVVSLNKKALADVYSSLDGETTKEVLKLREEFSKSSNKKYEAFLRACCADNHVRGTFQFYGAATGRWAGRLVQLQNLPHDTLPDLDQARDMVLLGDAEDFEFFYPKVQSALSALIRTMIIPEEGQRLIVADYSAIEARVIAWISKEQWRIDAFANNKDIYCESASKAFHVPVVKHGVNGELRAKGKVIELACGYGGSVGAMENFGAKAMGMTNEEMADLVAKWREASPHIVALWGSLEKAAIKCIKTGKPQESTVGNIRFDMDGGALWMRLPSGRRIAYWGADMGKDRWGRESITYMSQNQTTRKWERTETFGGKLAENCVQATARDVLKEALLNLDSHHYSVRATVHDEVIITATPDQTLEEVIQLMCKGAEWTEGLPLNADGYYCTSYRKD